MTPKSKSVDEILDKLFDQTILDIDRARNRAKASLRELLLEGLGKEKELKSKSDTWLDWETSDFIRYGYNQALADCRERIKELLK